MRHRINPHHAGGAETTQERCALRRDDAGLAPFAFLFCYSRPERWWFEVADALRRGVMIGGLVFVEDDGALRPCVGFVLACFSLILFREAEPYLSFSVNTLATGAQWQLMATYVSVSSARDARQHCSLSSGAHRRVSLARSYFVAILIKGQPFDISVSRMMWPLLVVNVALVLAAIAVQYSSGSAALEAELKTMENAQREAELLLTIIEMRLDQEKLRERVATLEGDDSLTQPRFSDDETRRRQSRALKARTLKAHVRAGKSACCSAPRTEKLPISFDFGHFPCMVVSHDNLRSLESIIIHEDARNLDIMEELTATSRAPSCAYSYFISQSVCALPPLALAAFG